jgi:NAD-dependent dihydropyrimidine dehydrogenase PreA subunit
MKIEVNDCKNPKDCAKCVQICPAKTLVLKPTGTHKLDSHVEDWKIKAIFKDLCDGCMKCVEICPEDCIKVEF